MNILKRELVDLLLIPRPHTFDGLMHKKIMLNSEDMKNSHTHIQKGYGENMGKMIRQLEKQE